MKTFPQLLTLAGLSLLLVLTASYSTQARNDTLRPIARLSLPTEPVDAVQLLAQPGFPAYFGMDQPAPEVLLDLPSIRGRLLPSRRFLLGPAGMPMQDFVFTQFSLTKPAKER